MERERGDGGKRWRKWWDGPVKASWGSGKHSGAFLGHKACFLSLVHFSEALNYHLPSAHHRAHTFRKAGEAWSYRQRKGGAVYPVRPVLYHTITKMTSFTEVFIHKVVKSVDTGQQVSNLPPQG